jgi:hypothetical protein
MIKTIIVKKEFCCKAIGMAIKRERIFPFLERQ